MTETIPNPARWSQAARVQRHEARIEQMFGDELKIDRCNARQVVVNGRLYASMLDAAIRTGIREALINDAAKGVPSALAKVNVRYATEAEARP